MNKQNQSSFQQHQEQMAKQKLQNSLNTICERRSWHDAQQFSSICRPVIDHLSCKDAQWLANKNYSDCTKVNILLALSEEQTKVNRMAPHRRNKKIFGATAIASGAATAVVTQSFHDPKTTITATCLMGLITLGALVKWAYHTGRYERIFADHTVYNTTNKNFQHGLQRLIPKLYRKKTKA